MLENTSFLQARTLTNNITLHSGTINEFRQWAASVNSLPETVEELDKEIKIHETKLMCMQSNDNTKKQV